MNIRKAQRSKTKIKLALQGPAGSGKTYSSILLAYGLVDDNNKIVILDTENGSADLYSHLGDYMVLPVPKPFSPANYIKCIDAVIAYGAEVLIIDSLSQSWEFLLQYHSTLSGNSFTNWSKITPLHNQLINKILSTDIHIICTMRVKTDYILKDNGSGKLAPEKVGMKAIQRDGIDYEFHLLFELDINHNTNCSKDRTGLFKDQPNFIIDRSTGVQIKQWCTGDVIDDLFIQDRINEVKSIAELTAIYTTYITQFEHLKPLFTNKKNELITTPTFNTKTLSNGTYTNH